MSAPPSLFRLGLVFAAALFLVAPPDAASNDAQQKLRDASTQGIRELRSQITEIPAIAETPWLGFNPGRANQYCNQGFLKTTQQLTEQCAADAKTILPALVRILAPGTTAVFDASQQQKPVAGQSIQDAAAVLGTPVTAVDCLLTGAVRARYGDHPGMESVLNTKNAGVDIYQAVGLLQAGAGATRSLSNAAAGSTEISRLGMLGEDLSNALNNNALGTLDSSVGPSQASGWFGRISEAWDSSTTGRKIDATMYAYDAKNQFEACEIDEALKSQERVLEELRAWTMHWRRWIELWESDRYCAETGWMAQMGFNPGDGGQLEKQVRAYISAIQGLDDDVLDPAWAKPGSIEKKRREKEDLRERYKRLIELVGSLGTSCMIDEALQERRLINTSNPCFETLFGTEGVNRLARIDRKLHALKLVIGDLQPVLGPAVHEAEARIALCRMTTWQEPLQRAISELKKRNTSDISFGQLKACWAGEWPELALAEKAQEREQGLAAATRETRELLEGGKQDAQECAFDAAAAKLDASSEALAASGCSLEADYCSADHYEPAICSLVILQSEIDSTREEISQRVSDLDQETIRIQQVAAELQAWSAEQMELVQQVSAARCPAVDQIRQIANDLEGLKTAMHCPGEAAYAEQAAALRSRLNELLAAFDQRLDELFQSGKDAAESCDSEALQGAVDGLTPVEAAACPPRSDLSAHLNGLLEKLKQENEDTRMILLEAQEDYHRWMQSCDTSLLHTSEARLSQLPTCGYKHLDMEAQQRASNLIWWGESAARLRMLAHKADPALASAQTLIERVRASITHGLLSSEERSATEADVQRVLEKLGEAREKTSAMQTGELIPKACADNVRKRIAELEALLPDLPRTSGVVSQQVSVPDLKGMTRRMAEAYLSDFGLSWTSNKDHEPPIGSKPGTVTRQFPASGAMVEKRHMVNFWIADVTDVAEEPPEAQIHTTGTAISEAYCSQKWPGTYPRSQTPGGVLNCLCPNGSAWSKVRHRCLSLTPGGTVMTSIENTCRNMPGTLLDSVSGHCRCTVGVWDANAWRCIDTAAEDRQRRIGERQQGAECERLFSNILIHRSDPSPMSQQLAAAAEQEARRKGCDAGRIADASDRGSRALSQPPSGVGGRGDVRPGVPVGSGQTGSGTREQGQGTRCVISNMRIGGNASALGYLVYHAAPPQPGAPETYGVITVAARIENRGRVECSGARACLELVLPGFPDTIVGGAHRSFSSAYAVVQQRCKNPVYEQ